MQTNTGLAIDAQNLTKKFKVTRRAASESVADNRSGNGSVDGYFTAVDNLSFQVGYGEIFGLLGPNGAGKTTTMRMLATLIKPTAGDALVAGHSIVSDPKLVRASIGFLTSELKLEDFFTPDYLFDFFSLLHQVDPAVVEQRKLHMFSRFGIDEFSQTKVSKLSTGMKQKTSLAISLVHDPDLIIFDEPTNGLDILTARVVTDYLEELRDMGKTIVLSTHIFSLAEKLCDRVGVIMDGEMVVEGTLAELTSERDLEETFFALYSERHPEEVIA